MAADRNPTDRAEIYLDGRYLEKTGGSWHMEDSSTKARWVLEMLARHPEVSPNSVCDIGCGAGAVLASLQAQMPGYVSFTGYEISPAAHGMSQRCGNARCRFVLGDAFSEPECFDLVLVLDVVEHVEDCFSFLRQAKKKGRHKLYHIPLDAHVSALLRGVNSWDAVGHIHLFTIETALKSLQYTGHRIIDWRLTNGALELPSKPLSTRIVNVARGVVSKVHPPTAARLLGGCSMLILSE